MSLRWLQGAPSSMGTGQGHSLLARKPAGDTHPGKISAADRDSGHGKEKIYQHVPKGYFGGGRVGLGIFRSFSIFSSMFTFYIEHILLW